MRASCLPNGRVQAGQWSQPSVSRRARASEACCKLRLPSSSATQSLANPGRRAWMTGKPLAQAAHYAAGLVRVAFARPSPPRLASRELCDLAGRAGAGLRSPADAGQERVPDGGIMGYSGVCGDFRGWHCGECVVAAGRRAQCQQQPRALQTGSSQSSRCSSLRPSLAHAWTNAGWPMGTPSTMNPRSLGGLSPRHMSGPSSASRRAGPAEDARLAMVGCDAARGFHRPALLPSPTNNTRQGARRPPAKLSGRACGRSCRRLLGHRPRPRPVIAPTRREVGTPRHQRLQSILERVKWRHRTWGTTVLRERARPTAGNNRP